MSYLLCLTALSNNNHRTADEALLKRCSHFDLQLNKENAVKACDAIVKERSEQKEQCLKELQSELKVARKQQMNLAKHAGKLSEKTHFEVFVLEVAWEGVGDEEARQLVLKAFKEAEIDVPKAALKDLATNEPSSKANGGGKPVKKSAPKTKSSDDKLPQSVSDQLWEHREHTAVKLRPLVKELVGRIRSLRYFEAVRDLQQGRTTQLHSDVPPNDCPSCGKKDIPVEELGVLSTCGHKGCLGCLKELAREKEACVFAATGECKCLSRPTSVVEASSLGVDDKERDGKGKHYGRKLEDIIELIECARLSYLVIYLLMHFLRIFQELPEERTCPHLCSIRRLDVETRSCARRPQNRVHSDSRIRGEEEQSPREFPKRQQRACIALACY
jgi:hypothetical protein